MTSMKLSITVIVLLALTFSGYAATRPSASRAEAAARRVCLDRAQASGHRVQGGLARLDAGRGEGARRLRHHGERGVPGDDRHGADT